MGDERAAVDKNRTRFLEATGAAALALLDQVHGDRVVEIRPGEPGITGHGEADASWTRAPNTALGIGIADCLPILLAAPDIVAVGAAHAGWRGAELRIGAKLVKVLAGQGADPLQMKAVLGPCIRRCCDQVSPDLAGRFEDAFGPQVVDRSRPKPHLDLAVASRLALREAGLAEAAIDDTGLCTACDAQRFFSHRRDQGRTGRMLAFIALRPRHRVRARGPDRRGRLG